MKILLLAQSSLSHRLGGPKVVLEVGAALKHLGCDVCVLGPHDAAARLGLPEPARRAEIGRIYDALLRREAADFDVVDYDHAFLPFSRDRYAAKTLMVARSVLLLPHLRWLRLPESQRWRHCLGRWLQPWKYAWAQRRTIAAAERTLQEADLINVSNRSDVRLLRQRYQVDESRIVELPFGVSRSMASELSACVAGSPGALDLVMVGTFDYRKGCLDLPGIFGSIRTVVPDATLTLLGCRGLFQEASAVLSSFAEADRGAVKVVMDFAPETLPEYLNKRSFGLFPSYFEGFGIGVVEMLAAGIPVVAYDAPGPDSILAPEALVPVGSTTAMVDRLLEWWRESDDDQSVRRSAARERAENFVWDRIAEATLRRYEQCLRMRSEHI